MFAPPPPPPPSPPTELPVLVQIPASHYVERARWALDLARISYAVRSHLPIFHYADTWLYYGSRTVPLLVIPAVRVGGRQEPLVLKDSQAIVDWADRHGSLNLYPAEHCSEIRELVAGFLTRLGVHIRRLAYFALLHPSNAELAFSVLADRSALGLSHAEGLLGRLLLPLIKVLLKRALRIDEPAARRSLSAIEEIFCNVRQRLERVQSYSTSGPNLQVYLVGGKFTAADLTFASMVCPLLRMKADVERFQFGKEILTRLLSDRCMEYAQSMYTLHRQHLLQQQQAEWPVSKL